MSRRTSLLSTTAFLLAASVFAAGPAGAASPPADPQAAVKTATPIKHIVILYNENVSFDHYFATYPKAANPPGEPAFEAAGDTPRVDNLASAALLEKNPNTDPANGAGASLPFRLDRTQANTADQNHLYT